VRLGTEWFGRAVAELFDVRTEVFKKSCQPTERERGEATPERERPP
jgi:hypothetical protein